MKTIFITITKGLLVRNLLRTSLLDRLSEDKNNRIIIFIPNIREVEAPEYLFREFERENVKIEIVKNKILTRPERLFSKIIFKFVFSKSTKLYLRFHTNRDRRINNFSYFVYWLIFSPLSKIKTIKKIIRWMDKKFFKCNKEYATYFDKYNPDLVFATSIVNHFDIDFLKEAKKRGIKTVSMPRSWDNLDKFMFRVEPDLFLVQNQVMKKETERYQSLDSKIEVVGFPQFDIYADKEVVWTKEKYCELKGFDPKLPILFLGSEGYWSQGDEVTFKYIVDNRDSGNIPDCNILIRPHFSMARKHNYHDVFKNCKNIFVDDEFKKSVFFHDNWDPGKEDMADFTNSLFHCSIMITFASTLALDTVCFDKPIIAIRYGVKDEKGNDETHFMYETCHYDWVIKTKAISLVDNNKELLDEIRHYLQDPGYKHEERQNMINQLCYKVDGNSARRIAEYILEML